MSNQTLSFAGLIGNDTILRVTDGILTSMSQRIDIHTPVELDLSIIVGYGGYSITRTTDPYDCLPIGDKRVDDCTIEELLFAVKHKLTK